MQKRETVATLLLGFGFGLIVAATDDLIGLGQRLSFILAGILLIVAVLLLMR